MKSGQHEGSQPSGTSRRAEGFENRGGLGRHGALRLTAAVETELRTRRPVRFPVRAGLVGVDVPVPVQIAVHGLVRLQFERIGLMVAVTRIRESQRWDGDASCQ